MCRDDSELVKLVLLSILSLKQKGVIMVVEELQLKPLYMLDKGQSKQCQKCRHFNCTPSIIGQRPPTVGLQNVFANTRHSGRTLYSVLGIRLD